MEIVEDKKNVRDGEFYEPLLKASQEAVENLQKKGWELAQIYWKWGRVLADVDTPYGDGTITALAEDVGKDPSVLYRARVAGVKYPTLVALKEAWEQGTRGNREMSWSRLTREGLPSPTDDPESYGGQTRVADQLMSEAERLMSVREKLDELLGVAELDDSKKREIIGVLEQIDEVTNSPAANIEGGYTDYITTVPCVVCDEPDSKPYSLTLSGVPQTQITYIPLCADHYTYVDEYGQTDLKKMVGLDYYKVVLKLLAPWVVTQNADSL